MAISLATLRQIYNQENTKLFKDKQFTRLLDAIINEFSEDEVLSEAQQFEIFDLIFNREIKTNLRGNLLAEIVGGNAADALILIKTLNTPPQLNLFPSPKQHRWTIQDSSVKKNKAVLDFLEKTTRPGVLLQYSRGPFQALGNCANSIIRFCIINNAPSFWFHISDTVGDGDGHNNEYNGKYDLQRLVTNILPKLTPTELFRFLMSNDRGWNIASVLFVYSQTWFIDFLIQNKTMLDNASRLTILKSVIPTTPYLDERPLLLSNWTYYDRNLLHFKHDCMDAATPDTHSHRWDIPTVFTVLPSWLSTGRLSASPLLNEIVTFQEKTIEWAVHEDQFKDRLHGFKPKNRSSISRIVLPNQNKLPQLVSIADLIANIQSSDSQLTFDKNTYAAIANYSADMRQSEINHLLAKPLLQLSKSEVQELLLLIDQIPTVQDSQRVILNLVNNQGRDIPSLLLQQSNETPLSLNWLLFLLHNLSPLERQNTCNNLIKILTNPNETDLSLDIAGENYSSIYHFRGTFVELQAIVMQIISRDYPINDQIIQVTPDVKNFDSLRNAIMPDLLNAFLNQFDQFLNPTLIHNKKIKELIEEIILVLTTMQEINTIKELVEFFEIIYLPLSQCEDESLVKLADSILRIKTENGFKIAMLAEIFENFAWTDQLDSLCFLMNESVSPKMSAETRISFLKDLKTSFDQIDLFPRCILILKIFCSEQFSQITSDYKRKMLPKRKPLEDVIRPALEEIVEPLEVVGTELNTTVTQKDSIKHGNEEFATTPNSSRSSICMADDYVAEEKETLKDQPTPTPTPTPTVREAGRKTRLRFYDSSNEHEESNSDRSETKDQASTKTPN